MLENVKNLQQLALKKNIDVKPISQKVAKLIITLLPFTLIALPVMAIEPESDAIQDSENAVQKSEINNLPKPSFFPVLKPLHPPLPSDLKLQSEPKISPGEARLMREELEGLIGRFETTLFTAESQDSNLDISTGEVIQHLLNPQATAKKQVQKPIFKSEYQNAHLSLKQAKEGLKRFDYLIQQISIRSSQSGMVGS